jgi:hypothetical protein
METTYLFLNDYAGMSYEAVVESIANDYQVSQSFVDNYQILIAQLDGDGGYEESSYFLLVEKSTGGLFEVSGSHCSCYGFEGQFEPVATSIEYLISEKAYFGNNDQVKNFIQCHLVKMIRYLKIKEIFEF